MAFLDVGDGPAARGGWRPGNFACGRGWPGHVAFQIAFGPVFRILLEFHDDVAVDAFAPADGREVVAMDAGFQGAFVAVKVAPQG